MWQQLTNHAVALGWQPSQHIFQVCVRVVSIEFGALNEAHHCRATLARTKGASEQSIVPAKGNLGVILPISGSS
jgi:hypothetical protein